MKPTTAYFKLLLLLLFACANCYGSDFDERIRMSGFITIGGGISDADPYPGGDNPDDPEDKVNSNNETPKYTAGSGRFIINDDFNFNAYSKAGLQIDFSIDEKTNATFQFVARGVSDDYDPEMSWAYLSHRFKPDLVFRAGRFRVPIYLASDYLDVGIAYPWVAPPVEVYTTINMSNLNGIDLLYTFRAGSWLWKVQPFYGSSDFERGDFKSEFRDLIGLNTSLHYGDFQVRFAYMEYEFSIVPWPFNTTHAQLIDTLVAVGFDDAVVYGDPNGKTTRFTAFGVRWMPKQFLVMTEWAERINADGGPDVEGYYATIGYQAGEWLPHLTFAVREEKDRDKRFFPRFDELQQQQPQLAAIITGLSHSINGVEDNESESITLGLNYEFSDSMVAKLALTRVENKESTGLFEYATEDDTNHIMSVTIDAVF